MTSAACDMAAELAQEGWTLAEISGETGLSYAATRAALRRRGVQALPQRRIDIRRRAESMRPADAVDYLLGVVECLLADGPEADAHPTDAWGHFPYIQRRIVRALYDADGAVMSRAQIMAAAYYDRISADDWPLDRTIDVLLSKIRHRLPEGAKLETDWGHGWRLVVASDAREATE